jgi:RimJ/RimL family protein N-acetyltransferase
MVHSITLGAPEFAARAAVDKGWFKDGKDLRLMGYGKGLGGRVEATKHLKDAIERQDANSRVIGVYQDGLPVGFCWMEYLGDRHKTVKMHAFIAPEARGKWAFHIALVELLDKLFSEGVYRVEVEPLRINKRMIRLLRHYGFKQEGIKRSAYWMDGNDYDMVMMRLLKREWMKRKKEK